MPDLLLELLSEEIPARMQAQAAADLKKLVTDALVERGLLYEGAAGFATPRRLALHVAGLPARQPDTREERKGPRVGAPDPAIQGFLKAAGLASIDQATKQTDPKGKGEFYVAMIAREGRPTLDVLADILPAVVRAFPWPKSMRWGAASVRGDSLRWVRPLHSIVASFGPETEEPEIVPFEVGGIRAGNVTRGHRFLAPAAFKVRRFDDYAPALERAKVVLDPARRRDIILHDAKDLAFAQGLELVEDESLLAEVAGLIEWPVTLMGSFDAAFLDIPPDVIRATIRANQKCFVLRRPSAEAGRANDLANKFILVSNLAARDGGAAIVAGNERVVRARLADALYFWKTDQAPLPGYADKADKPLDQRLAKLRALNIVFHEKLGTQGERVDRIKALARELAPIVGADPEKAARAADLCKADLMSEVVGEFPETQGLMGARYAQLQGEDADVCAAIEEHYKPQGPADRVPTNPVAVTVALADKLDTLVGFWAIDEKPTGSKDPYALRRAALGVIRIVLENELRISLCSILRQTHERHLRQERNALRLIARVDDERFSYLPTWEDREAWSTTNADGDYEFNPQRWGLPENQRIFFFGGDISSDNLLSLFLSAGGKQPGFSRIQNEAFEYGVLRTLPSDLLAFFIDRLKVYLRDKGARHDLIDAAIGAAPPSPRLRGEGRGEGPSGDAPDDLLMITRRVEALAIFLDTDDGRNLLAGDKRAVNILRAEEKKETAGAKAFSDAPDASLFAQDEERALASAIETAARDVRACVDGEDFEGAMRALARLRAPVDTFFTTVTVNDADPARRLNRLRLLNRLRAATREVADFSKVAG